MVYKWSNIIQMIYPATCLLCQAPGRNPDTDLCPGCLRDLASNHPACPRCAIPVAIEGDSCARCLRQPPPFTRTIAPWRYEGLLAVLIQRLKDGHLAHARLLGALLAERLQPIITERPEAILPVPAHHKRLRERGFNQAIEIGREISRRLEIPLHPERLLKIRDTAHQAALTRKQRLSNLRNAFALRGEAPWQHVALLDDVITTGATTRELARLLQRHGVPRIEVWAIARTP